MKTRQANIGERQGLARNGKLVSETIYLLIIDVYVNLVDIILVNTCQHESTHVHETSHFVDEWVHFPAGLSLNGFFDRN